MTHTIVRSLVLCLTLLCTGGAFAQTHVPRRFKSIDVQPLPPGAPAFDKIDGRATPAARVAPEFPVARLKAERALRQAVPNVEIRYAPNGTLRYLKGDMPRQNPLTFMDQNAGLFGLRQPSQELNLRSTEKTEDGATHLRVDQIYLGIPVWGADLVLHTRDNQLYCINGRYRPTPTDADATPSVLAAQAATDALRHLAHHAPVRDLTAFEKQLLEYDCPQTELVWYAGKDDICHLTWHVTIRPDFLARWEYFIDARTGQVLNHYYHTCTEGPDTAQVTLLNGTPQTINTFELDGKYYLLDVTRQMYNAGKSKLPAEPVGAIWTLDAQNTYLDNLAYITSNDNTWTNQKSAASAHYNAAQAYEYYRTTHNRNSINGKGGSILSVVNVAYPDGSSMGNAFWNGQLMAYGNGDDCMKPLAAGLDVGAHEMTHGVIAATANLDYLNQSGAINESMADVFGVLVDRDDWLIGDEVILQSCGGKFRSMEAPHDGMVWQPMRMSEYKNMAEWDDNGGVHINSGIPNHAFYLFATAIGKDKAEKVYYRALTQYLTKSSEFLDLRIAVVQACDDLYTKSEADAARIAFDKVEIFDGKPTRHNIDLNPVEGRELLLLHGLANAATGITVYDPAEDKFYPLTDEEALGLATVTDDGLTVYYIRKSDN